MSVEEKINQAFLRASTKLAEKGMPGYKVVKYRLKKPSGGNPAAGIPPVLQPWSAAENIDPNPEIKPVRAQGISQTDQGILDIHDLRMLVNKPLFTRIELESFEYLIENREYSIVGGQVNEDPDRYPGFWIVYLRHKQ